MNEETSELRKKLGIDDWLELVKEDKNLKGAYICFGQYMDILEKREKQLQNTWNEFKKWLEEKIESKLNGRQKSVILYVYKKVQELEGNNDN